MRFRPVLIALMVAAVPGFALAKRAPVDYAAYAGPPVKEVRFTQLYNWERVDDARMVIWTRPGSAYLLGLRQNCDALIGQARIHIVGTDGIAGRLRAGTAEVVVDGTRCRVDTIRPIDSARLEADRKAAKAQPAKK